ncbi:MAG: glutamine--fructose-6-phosphate transaminase (isomerizing) [Methylotenera sp.]|nr:glutamine--fructose-6-phosphate transaminase (isomerizing) [Oligoflexia bacterium]
MCGIVGYVGKRPAIDILLKGLKRLEYRGYDSAGVAFFSRGKLEVRKSQGKLENVERLMDGSSELFADAHCGIGHTRWATHGKPTTQNAHPHRAGHVVIVHNGIIENYQEIKAELISRGHKPESETDSELFGFLVLEAMEKGQDLVTAVRTSFAHLEGACSVVVMSEREPGKVVGVRNGSPMAAAFDPQGGAILASDAQPILEYTKEVIFLENGDVVVGTEKGLAFFDLKTGAPLDRVGEILDWSVDKIDKGGFPHFMLKEIHEQPAALVDTLNGIMDRVKTNPFPLAAQPGADLLRTAKEITFVACGTSWHAALLGKYWIERFARIPVNVELASEFRYRDPVLAPGALVIGMSQSGETADTLAVIRDVKKRGFKTLGLTNVRGSTLSREADAIFYTSAGPEIGVAATKTFTTQMLAVLLWAGYLGIEHKAPRTSPAGTPNAKPISFEELFHEIVKLPHQIKECLDDPQGMITAVRSAAKQLQNIKGFFFIGRGFSYPIALEGALKLKEIAYVHAEGYAAGELKHGPIAMIDQDMAVVVLAPQDSWRDKTVSNLEEVKARGAKIVAIGGTHDQNLKNLSDFWIPLPAQKDESLLPFLMTAAVQMLSYELALLKGTDVDKPRNLAKSVTVE